MMGLPWKLFLIFDKWKSFVCTLFLPRKVWNLHSKWTDFLWNVNFQIGTVCIKYINEIYVSFQINSVYIKTFPEGFVYYMYKEMLLYILEKYCSLLLISICHFTSFWLFGQEIVSLIGWKRDKRKFMIVNSKTFRNYFILSPAYSLIMWLMRSSKNF